MVFSFKENGIWGMINEKGDIVVKPMYERVSDYSEDYAVAIKNPKWFYLDETGKSIMQPRMDEGFPFHGGMASIIVNKRIGYINKKFEVAVFPRYSAFSSNFNEGLSAVCMSSKSGEHKYGYINNNDERIIDFKYEIPGYFSEGLAVVTLNDKVGAIDKNDKFIIDNKYDSLSDFKEGRAFFSKDYLWGIVDNHGNEIVEARFVEDEADYDHYDRQNFSEGLAVICENKKYGYIDRNGRVASDIIYDFASSFIDEIASVRIGSSWFIINKGFNTISELNCDSVSSYKNGLASICVNGKWGFIDKRGNVVTEPKYEQVFDFENGAAGTILNGKYGYIDNLGKEFFRADKACIEPYYSFAKW